MTKCAFCACDHEIGRGMFMVTDEGKVFYFCSSKCRKNWNLGRKARKFKWARKTREQMLSAEASEKKE